MRHLSFILVLSLFACGQGKAPSSNAQQGAWSLQYDLNNPDKEYKLPDELEEISGIAYRVTDKTLLAINDEHGDLYKIRLGDSTVTTEVSKFAKHGDYEDLTIVGSTCWILKSNGTLYHVEKVGEEADDDYQFPLKGHEFESLTFDKLHSRLLLLCKNCSKDQNKKVPVYAFDLMTLTFAVEPVSYVNAAAILKLEGHEANQFRPSAMAIHPQTKQWYILSSVNKLLAVLDADGTVLGVEKLEPKRFPQPEGLTFSSEGTMFISNEGKGATATILKFDKKN